ncbi:MAG: arsenosugar biosynthesis radical SAM protein ArsS [Chitinophagaceae bacterium]|nr:arsenosugar biosynthesis radical SAM protein ArsS [Chitinophagaceae bacterium]
MKSLKANAHLLADSQQQLSILENGTDTNMYALVPFQQKLEESGLYPLLPLTPSVFQVNVGKMCNQVCRHCHVDAGPDRKEIMTRQTMEQCLQVLAQQPGYTIVDITGGAPEMNPDFRWFVEQVRLLNRHVIVRCNLTIIVSNKKYFDLPVFFREHVVEVVSSLPFYQKDRTDRQRGDGVFDDSIKALQMLNGVGYGLEESPLRLNLVYNPAGAFLPPGQAALEQEFRTALYKDFGISFHSLYAITNLPISRFLDYLLESGNYEKYMQKLVNAYNPAAAANVMCRTTLSVSWNGYLHDCDFNQMLDLRCAVPQHHIADYDHSAMLNRSIVVNQHCYGCTAGAGSSCGGAVV